MFPATITAFSSFTASTAILIDLPPKNCTSYNVSKLRQKWGDLDGKEDLIKAVTEII